MIGLAVRGFPPIIRSMTGFGRATYHRRCTICRGASVNIAISLLAPRCRDAASLDPRVRRFPPLRASTLYGSISRLSSSLHSGSLQRYGGVCARPRDGARAPLASTLDLPARLRSRGCSYRSGFLAPESGTPNTERLATSARAHARRRRARGATHREWAALPSNSRAARRAHRIRHAMSRVAGGRPPRGSLARAPQGADRGRGRREARVLTEGPVGGEERVAEELARCARSLTARHDARQVLPVVCRSIPGSRSQPRFNTVASKATTCAQSDRTRSQGRAREDAELKS